MEGEFTYARICLAYLNGIGCDGIFGRTVALDIFIRKYPSIGKILRKNEKKVVEE